MELRKVVRSVLFVCISLAGVLTVVHAMLPPFWGNPGLARKVDYVERSKQPYDRLFIGSSHIFRQLSPRMLDSTLADGSRSFNMGFAATYSPEAELACEYVLRSKSPAIKEIYVELSPFNLYKEQNLKSSRDWYMVTPQVWCMLAAHAWGMQQNSRGQRALGMKGATIALIKATFLPGLVDQYLEREDPDEEMVFGPDGDGFVPLEWEMGHPGANPTFASRQAELKKDTTVLGVRRERAKALYQKGAVLNLSIPHRNLLFRLMALGDAHGTKVIFILPPLSYSSELMGLYAALPPDRRIDLCDPVHYPEFYFTRNTFDKGHLNTKGSHFFTNELAKAIQRLNTSGTSRSAETEVDPEPGTSP